MSEAPSLTVRVERNITALISAEPRQLGLAIGAQIGGGSQQQRMLQVLLRQDVIVRGHERRSVRLVGIRAHDVVHRLVGEDEYVVLIMIIVKAIGVGLRGIDMMRDLDAHHRLRSCRQRLDDLGPELACDVLGRDSADQLVGDAAVASDHERFRHAIDAPLDRGAAVAVDADDVERVAVAAKKATGVIGRIFLVDADHLHALRMQLLAEREQQRRLVMARHAPRRPDIDDADMPFEGGRVEARHRRAGADQAVQCRQLGQRRRVADQGRGNSRGIAGAQAKPEDRGQAGEHNQGGCHQP